jgi:Short C-terminal domain
VDWHAARSGELAALWEHCRRDRATDGHADGTVGFRAAGEIEREDFDEVLVPEFHRALEAKELLDSGAITQEEFEALKAKVLA